MKNVKHIFYSHSWITQIVIEAFIEYKDISISDVIILSNRNFKECINPELKNKFINNRKLLIPNLLHRVFSGNKVERYLKWFNNLTQNNNFILYIPHLYPIELKLMLHHQNCKGCYFIEEGELSYQSSEHINNLHNYESIKNSNFDFFMPQVLSEALLTKTIDEPKINGTIQLFDEAFLYSKNKIILKEEIQKLFKMRDWKLIDYNNILILSPYIDVLNMKTDIYFEGLVKSLNYINDSNDEVIYYKFHPSDRKEVRERTKEILDNYENKFKIIDDGISLEAILFSQKPKIYSFVSSISLYAFLLNCELEIISEFITPGKSKYQKVNDISLEPYYIKLNLN